MLNIARIEDEVGVLAVVRPTVTESEVRTLRDTGMGRIKEFLLTMLLLLVWLAVDHEAHVIIAQFVRRSVEMAAGRYAVTAEFAVTEGPAACWSHVAFLTGREEVGGYGRCRGEEEGRHGGKGELHVFFVFAR
jgi:hypothetical protein